CATCCLSWSHPPPPARLHTAQRNDEASRRASRGASRGRHAGVTRVTISGFGATDPSGMREGRPRVAILGALACSARLHFAVTRRSRGGELVDQPTGGRGDFVDGALENGLIGARRSAGAAQLADELDCRGADLLVA